MSLFGKIEDTALFIQAKTNNKRPGVGIILGSGLGGLLDVLEKETEITYKELPHFPEATVDGHEGKLVFGRLSGKDVVMMAGRFHYYEGYSMEQLTFPVRVMKAIGVETLIVSNAAGGMHKEYKVGDLVFINDHINLFQEHPLRGPNDERLGVRFPDMSEPYDLGLVAKAVQIAKEKNIRVHQGVYVGLTGPTFETRAEYRWLSVIGGDVVGMSTVPEVIVARHAGMKVFAASVVTDLGLADQILKITHEEVLKAANEAAPKLAAIVEELVSSL